MLTAPIARAIALFVFAISVIPIVDAVAKTLSTSHDISPVTVTLLRFVAQTAVILSIFAVLTIVQSRRTPDDTRASLPTPRATLIAANLGRGLLHGSATMFFFVALKYMPLADTIAVFFVEPMIVLLLSAVFLGEYIGWPRRIASIIAFGGALLVIQPSYELFGPVSLLPLLAALCFATYFIITRRLTDRDHPLTMQLWSGIGGMLLAASVLGVMSLIGESAPADYAFTMPSGWIILWLALLLGSVSTLAHVSIAAATGLAPASVLAPFNYLEIVSATLLGYLFFQEFPGGMQWLGISIIVSMGIVVFLRERSLERCQGAQQVGTPSQFYPGAP